MHEIPRQVLIRIPPVLGVDLSVTNEVILLWLAAGITFAVVTAACRRRGPVPRGWLQNSVEALVEFIDREVVRGAFGRPGGRGAALLLTLFFFTLFCNLLGIVPLPDFFKAVTSNLSVTAGLAGMVFAVSLAVNLRHHGVKGFVKGFMPPGVHWSVGLFVALIEVLSWLAKPVSLAVRLFANMMAGHALILIFVGLEMTVAWAARPLPLAGAVVMSAFELFVCFVQAFIFTMLTGIYLREARETH